MERRQWFQLMALLAAAAPQVGQAQQASARKGKKEEPPPRISKEMLQAALATMGLEFSDEHLQLMLPRVNRGLDSIEQLRKIDIPLDTEPAIRFTPPPPDRTVSTAVFRPSRTPAPSDWSTLEDLAFRPLTELAALVRARRVTSIDLTRMYLDRLEALSPKLLFAVTITRDLALEQAAQADAEIRRGKYRGPLHGIPWGAKDLFATKGIPTTWGAEPFQNQVFDYDATVVERLTRAGAVLVAKLSMGALAMGGLWFRGMTKTPWNLEQTSSGSSAGSASATAAGCVGFSIGTETLGSIISPSIRCGTVGLRPTYGRVSRFGAMGLSWTMDKVGPICRGVEDCALVLRAIHGSDGKDTSVVDAPLDWQPARPLSSLRIGVIEKSFEELNENEKPVYQQAVEDLKKAGAKLVPATLPDIDPGPLLVILSAEAATAFDDITRDGRVGQLKDQSRGAWPNSFRTSRLIPAVEYIRAQRARTLLMRKMEEFFGDWDVLVSAPYGASLLSITNLTGHPQVVVPCGFVDGLPRGLVFTGHCYREGDPMRVALAYERATQWHRNHPSLS